MIEKTGAILWSDEIGFSNWLHQNIDALGVVIGLRLISRQREAPVGRLSADLLAEIADTNHSVIIENQIYVADHGHFGQVITYAAHYNAHAIIWISTSFRNEYRVAIEWLNDVSDKRFFAVELRTDGDIPNFVLVAGPKDALAEDPSLPVAGLSAADATKLGKKGAYIPAPFAAISAKSASPGQLALDTMFERIAQLLTDSRAFGSIRKIASDRNYFAFASGPVRKSEWSIVFTDTEIRLELVFNEETTANEDLRRMRDHSNELSAAVGQEILFEVVENRKKQKVIIRRLLSYDERARDEDGAARWCSETITQLAEAVACAHIFS